jgi:hypothetical protein
MCVASGNRQKPTDENRLAVEMTAMHARATQAAPPPESGSGELRTTAESHERPPRRSSIHDLLN